MLLNLVKIKAMERNFYQSEMKVNSYLPFAWFVLWGRCYRVWRRWEFQRRTTSTLLSRSCFLAKITYFSYGWGYCFNRPTNGMLHVFCFCFCFFVCLFVKHSCCYNQESTELMMWYLKVTKNWSTNETPSTPISYFWKLVLIVSIESQLYSSMIFRCFPYIYD